MGKSECADKHVSCTLEEMRLRAEPDVPPRRSRWWLVPFGVLFLAQGLGKAVDPTGYMAALDAFHVLRPAALTPLSLGALALSWTVLELLAGVAMLYGGLARAPAKELALAGLALALGLSGGYLALELGAFARHLPIQSCTSFGAYLGQRLTWGVLVQEALVIGALTWQVTKLARWPSLAATSGQARRSRHGWQHLPSRTFERAASRG